MNDDYFETATYIVVINDEEQYSIWLDGRDIPPGWRKAGKTGPKAECLAYVDRVWTDMRPLSLRRRMEEAQRHPPAAALPSPPEPSLVERLSASEREVEIWLGSRPDPGEFQRCLDRGYVHVRFLGTRGDTILGVRLGFTQGDDGSGLEGRVGRIRLVGRLSLDYVACRCEVEVDVQTLKGSGRLSPLDEAAVASASPA